MNKNKTASYLLTLSTIILSVVLFFSGVVKADEQGYLNKVLGVDFQRTADGDAVVLVNLAKEQSVADVRMKDKDIVVDFLNTDIAPDLLYVMDVADFATSVFEIETFKEKDTARLVIRNNKNFSYQFNQLSGVFTLTVSEASDKEAPKKQYVGDPISLDFQDVSIRRVLQIIASHNGFNLVTTDTVTGNVTLRLDGVPWDQALDVLLKVKGLDKRLDGSILLVAPAEEIAVREEKELQMKQKAADLAPLQSEFLQINYAKASELATLLKGENANLLSARGSVTVDERTNTLLLRDTANSIEDVKRLIRVLDIPVRQVIIESRMVSVKDNIQEDLGIRWGISDQQNSDGFSGTLQGAEALSNGQIPGLQDRLNVNLPITSPAGSIGFHVAKLSDGTLLDLELSALERENKAEIIASPRITTANQKSAFIEQGTEIPYVQAASSGATTVTFKKAVLSLTVTPHITPDNRIILDLVITQDNRGDTVSTPTGPAVAIDTQRIDTQVLVENGETIVLGGIYQQQVVNATTKVPVLGDIPYLGSLFRQTSDFNEKKELLIFVTPRIVTE